MARKRTSFVPTARKVHQHSVEYRSIKQTHLCKYFQYDIVINLIRQCADRQEWDGNIEPFRNLINERRRFASGADQGHFCLPYRLDFYHDGIARRVLEKITVVDIEHFLVKFKGGVAVEQVLLG